MAPGRSTQPLATAAGAVALLIVLGLLLLCAPCLAQTEPVDASDQVFTGEVLSRAALYLGVTVVCVAVFSLVFLKCWNDVNQALGEQEGQAGGTREDEGGETS